MHANHVFIIYAKVKGFDPVMFSLAAFIIMAHQMAYGIGMKRKKNEKNEKNYGKENV